MKKPRSDLIAPPPSLGLACAGSFSFADSESATPFDISSISLKISSVLFGLFISGIIPLVNSVLLSFSLTVRFIDLLRRLRSEIRLQAHTLPCYLDSLKKGALFTQYIIVVGAELIAQLKID